MAVMASLSEKYHWPSPSAMAMKITVIVDAPAAIRTTITVTYRAPTSSITTPIRVRRPGSLRNRVLAISADASFL